MEKIKLLFAGAFALLTLFSCSEKEDDNSRKEGEEDDAYYATQATISSSDSNFASNSSGGEIHFKSEGGQVVVNVSCGCDWIVENNAADLFATSITSTALTITAARNTVEQDLEGTITLKTANDRITFATLTITQTAYGAPEITVKTNEWNIPAKGVLTTEIAVEATDSWTAESADSWLTVAKTGSGISLAAAENEDTEKRTTKVTLACTDGIKTAYEYVTVNQEAAAYITFSSQTVSFGTGEGTSSVTVESNFDWDYSYDTSNGWFTVARNSNDLTVSVSANDGENRSGTVSVTAGDGDKNVTEAQLTISQSGVSEMILTYTITSGDTAVQLPLGGTVNCTVIWGDGSDPQTVTSNYPAHTYADTGEYDVIISGTVTSLNSGSISSKSSPNTTLTSVKQWGSTGLTNMQYAFYYCSNLASLPEKTNGVLANATSFYSVFCYCSSLKKVPEDLFGGCTKATNFGFCFNNCASLRSLPEGLFDDCTNATAFNSAFVKSDLVEIPSSLFQKCTKVTTFHQSFYGCSSLKNAPMFDKCTKAEAFDAAFYNCSLIAEIPEGMFDNCAAVTTFDSVFYGCSSLKTIPTGLFDDCVNVTTFYAAFYNCSGITTIPNGLFKNNTNVTDSGFTFYGCSSINAIPTGLFDSFTKLTGFYATFCQCKAIEEIPVGLFDNCPSVTSFKLTFEYCTSIKAIPKGLFDNCTKVTTFHGVFEECTSIKEIPAGLFDNCPLVTSFEAAFFETGITAIPAGLFDECPLVTTFSGTFTQCYSLTSIPEGLFDNCPGVTNFKDVFYYCNKLTSVPANLFSKNLEVTNFHGTFGYDSALTGESPYDMIDVNGVETKVHLYERANFLDIYAEPTSYTTCFYNCTKLSDYSSIPDDWKSRTSTGSISIEPSSITETSVAVPESAPESAKL